MVSLSSRTWADSTAVRATSQLGQRRIIDALRHIAGLSKGLVAFVVRFGQRQAGLGLSQIGLGEIGIETEQRLTLNDLLAVLEQNRVNTTAGFRCNLDGFIRQQRADGADVVAEPGRGGLGDLDRQRPASASLGVALAASRFCALGFGDGAIRRLEAGHCDDVDAGLPHGNGRRSQQRQSDHDKQPLLHRLKTSSPAIGYFQKPRAAHSTRFDPLI